MKWAWIPAFVLLMFIHRAWGESLLDRIKAKQAEHRSESERREAAARAEAALLARWQERLAAVVPGVVEELIQSGVEFDQAESEFSSLSMSRRSDLDVTLAANGRVAIIRRELRFQALVVVEVSVFVVPRLCGEKFLSVSLKGGQVCVQESETSIVCLPASANATEFRSRLRDAMLRWIANNCKEAE